MVEISERMREFLQDYAAEPSPGAIQYDVPRLFPWFPDEFDQLLRAHAFTPSIYGRIIHSQQLDTPDGWRGMDYTFREIWREACPDRTYPYDEPGVAPPELADSTDECGVSRRLTRVLKRHYKRRDSAPVDLTVVTRTVAGGGWSWLPGTLEAQIKAGVFTPSVWSELVYGGDPLVDEGTVDGDLRRLWAAAVPDRPYPLDA